MTSGGLHTDNDENLVHVGCAGWGLPGAMHDQFPAAGSHLLRYAAVLPAVEINTSFYRPHRPGTYARWRESVPEWFRFSAKIPKAITHEARLHRTEEALEKFIGEASHLEHKLGCLLVQLPPSLQFDAQLARRFFSHLRSLTNVPVACEPRHLTWFTRAAADLLSGSGVGYVEADPSIAPIPAQVDHADLVYLRMHGSPIIYHSAYSEEVIGQLQERIVRCIDAGHHAWCIFDNTASGAAVPNALSLLARLHLPRTEAAWLPAGQAASSRPVFSPR